MFKIMKDSRDLSKKINGINDGELGFSLMRK